MKRYVDVIPLALGAAVFLSVGQADADTVALGTDYFASLPTFFDFGPPIGIVALQGNPIGPGNTDTIVQRTPDLTIVGSGQPGPTVGDLKMTALSLVSVGLSPPIFITLDPIIASTGTISISGPVGSGTFDSTLNVHFDVCTGGFGANGQGCGTGTLLSTGMIQLMSSGTMWAPSPPPCFDDRCPVIVPGLFGDLAANLHTGLPPNEVDFFLKSNPPQFPFGCLHCPSPHPVEQATVPGPIVGAGLPGLILAGGVLLLLARRRRQQTA